MTFHLNLTFSLAEIVGRALPKNFDLSISGNDLNVTFCHIDFCPVEHFSDLQLEI